MFNFIRTHKVGVGASAVVAIAGLAWLAFGFFGVHTLFIDDVVDEAGPVFDASPAVITDDADPEIAQVVAPRGDDADDETIDEAVPPDSAADAPAAPTEPATDTPVAAEAASAEIVSEFVGTFTAEAHPAVGTATVLGNGTGQRFLRLSDFETDNGPDLNVYLFNANGDRSDYIDLGDLKGNIGDQNYEIPEGVDLSVYSEVSIWCVRFGVGFGSAELMPV